MRINIVGVSAAGKSTLAQRLSDILEIPATDLDELHWRPNWQEAPLEELRSDVAGVAQRESWIIAGNYRQVRDVVWPRVTHIVWLNYSFWTVWYRVVTRTCRRVVTRERVCNGNTEQLWRTLFHPDSILLWVLRTYRPRKREFRALFAQPEWSHVRVVEITDPSLTPEQIADRLEQA